MARKNNAKCNEIKKLNCNSYLVFTNLHTFPFLFIDAEICTRDADDLVFLNKDEEEVAVVKEWVFVKKILPGQSEACEKEVEDYMNRALKS